MGSAMSSAQMRAGLSVVRGGLPASESVPGSPLLANRCIDRYAVAPSKQQVDRLRLIGQPGETVGPSHLHQPGHRTSLETRAANLLRLQRRVSDPRSRRRLLSELLEVPGSLSRLHSTQ
jgi:hypothetical protein